MDGVFFFFEFDVESVGRSVENAVSDAANTIVKVLVRIDFNAVISLGVFNKHTTNRQETAQEILVSGEPYANRF